ncbi:F-box protein At5g07610-like [Humulus lupulus]|uniref:F-box protein At5g07610-like n=1 Tax=Humulus lupulus TaxID=3486 RepID=UPI002B40074C|nr:F-box protein At5g07610-like [Humulus lupulus]
MDSTRIIQSENDSSATIIATNQDLITQILVRLPIKSLLRFKCVCKHWLFFISNPEFSHGRKDSLTISALVMRFLFSLMLIEKQENTTFIIPSPPAKTISLPSQIPTDFFFNRVYGSVLAYDPFKSPDDKVICVLRSKFKNRFVIDIFSSETTSWKRFATRIRASKQVCSPKNKGVGGWLSLEYIGTFRGNFHVFCECKKTRNYREYYVYVMKKDYSEWITKYRFDLDAVAISYPVMRGVLS